LLAGGDVVSARTGRLRAGGAAGLSPDAAVDLQQPAVLGLLQLLQRPRPDVRDAGPLQPAASARPRRRARPDLARRSRRAAVPVASRRLGRLRPHHGLPAAGVVSGTSPLLAGRPPAAAVAAV